MENAKPDVAGRHVPNSRTWALIDSRPLTRLSFERLLKCSGRDFTLAAFASVDELFGADGEPQIDVQLIIYRMATRSVTDEETRAAIARLISKFPHVPLVLIGEREGMEDAQQAISLGARGYITTSLDPCLVVEALRMVRSGGVFVPPKALIGFAGLSLGTSSGKDASSSGDENDALRGVALTFREVEVMREIAKGMSNKCIARSLNIQEGTVKVYVRQLMKKLKAVNRTQIALMARQTFADLEI